MNKRVALRRKKKEKTTFSSLKSFFPLVFFFFGGELPASAPCSDPLTLVSVMTDGCWTMEGRMKFGERDSGEEWLKKPPFECSI